tara:strand:- start:441 stop:881 length:441 start_codon:yes stop_codon:yes gene_type:complete
MLDLYEFLNERGYEVREYREENIIFTGVCERFDLNGFTFTFHDKILNIGRSFVDYRGKDSPIVGEEFETMVDMMQKYHKIGRIVGTKKPLSIILDWCVIMETDNDLHRAQLIYEQLAEVYDLWQQLVFDVIHNGADFEELYMEMEE